MKEEKRYIRLTQEDAVPGEGMESDDASARGTRQSENVRDGGWGWMCVFGCSVIFILQGGFGRSFGVVYVRILEEFHSSATTSSTIGGLFAALRMGCGPLVSILTKHYSNREVAAFGGFLLSIGALLSGFATTTAQMFFTYSYLCGVGGALVYFPGFLIIAEYFDRRRGIAMSIATAGSAIGAITMPPIYQFLFDQYGFQGSFVILSAILLNTVAAALVYRPVTRLLVNVENVEKIQKNQDSSCISELSNHTPPRTTYQRLDNQKPHPFVHELTNGTPLSAAGDIAEAFYGKDKTSNKEKDKKFDSESILAEVARNISNDIRQKSRDASPAETETVRLLHAKSETSDYVTCLKATEHDKNKVSTTSESQTRHRSSDNNYLTDDEEYAQKSVTVDSVLCSVKIHPGASATEAGLQLCPQAESLQQNKECECTKIAAGADADKSFGSTESVAVNGKTKPCDRTSTAYVNLAQYCRNAIQNISAYFLTQIELLRCFSFATFALATTFSTMSYIASHNLIIAHAEQQGIPSDQSVFLITIIAVPDLVGRILFGLVADIPSVRPWRSYLYALILFAMGVVTISWAFTVQYIPIATIAIVNGLLCGAIVAGRALIVADLAGIERFSSAFPLAVCCQGVGVLTGPALAGYMKDLTGTYVASFLFTGSCACFAGLVFFIGYLYSTRILAKQPSAEPLT